MIIIEDIWCGYTFTKEQKKYAIYFSLREFKKPPILRMKPHEVASLVFDITKSIKEINIENKVFIEKYKRNNKSS